MKKIKTALIGLGQRGHGLLINNLVRYGDVELVSVCDSYSDRAEAAAQIVREKTGGSPQICTDYREAIKSAEAVIIAAAWEAHTEIAVAAMLAGKAVGLEVGGAYTVEDCWKLVDTWEETRVPFMFLENCCYDKTELMSLAMARDGVFGEIVYCSGAYSHDLRDEILSGDKNRHYRLRNYLHRNCENYPTHELGPIAKLLDINRGNRMVRLVSVSTKAAGLEALIRAQPEKYGGLDGARFSQGDIINTIITCAGGQTISLVLDTTLPGFYDRALQIRGTKGMYNQTCNIVLTDGDVREEKWTGIENVSELVNNGAAFEQKYLPDFWKNITDEERETGHGGMDGFMLRSFFDALKNGREMPIDIYDAASWMSIACLSEQSIQLGAPVCVPDFTRGRWLTRPRKDVVELNQKGNT